MKKVDKRNAIKQAAIAGFALSALAAACHTALAAEDFYLCAEPVTMTLGGNPVAMWGFAADDNSDLSDGCPGAATVPGPMLSVPPGGDDTVNIHVLNNLPVLSMYGTAGGSPLSIVIPGQVMPLVGINAAAPAAAAPVFFTDSQGRQRVRSFTAETLPGQTGTYSWTGFRPGSFIYHSGTHPQVQVQMGLVGGIKRDDGIAGSIYSETYDQDVDVFINEVDVELHDAVAADDYGPLPTQSMHSTLTPPGQELPGYQPEFVLINGMEHGAAALLGTGLLAGGQKTLVRFFNAALRTHALTPLNLDMTVIAEDGYQYPYQRGEVAEYLTAMKTADALVGSPAEGMYAITDASIGTGAVLTKLDIGAGGGGSPTDTVTILRTRYAGGSTDQLRVWANSDQAPTAVLTVQGYGSDGVMDNVSTNPNFDYRKFVPNVASNPGSATVVSDLGGSDTQAVNYTAAPVAQADSYGTDEDVALNVAAPGVRSNDSLGGFFGGSDSVEAVVVSGPANGSLTLNADGSFDYTPNADFSGADSFSYQLQASTNGTPQAVGNTVTVALDVAFVNDPPVGTGDAYDATANATLSVAAPGVLVNDSDPEGDALSAVLDADVSAGTLTLNADGSFSYTPNAGTTGDSFTYFVSDGTSNSVSPVTVAITVTAAANTAPVASDDNASTDQNLAVTFDVIGNDSDNENNIDPASINIVVAPVQGGSVVANSNGTVTFTPATGFVGTDEFTYTVNDLGGLTSNEATVRVNVTSPNAGSNVLLYFSTIGNASVNGVPGPYDDADIYVWRSSGFTRSFDGNVDSSLPGNADIDGLAVIDADTFYVSFDANGGTSVPGLGTVQDEDVVLYDAGTWSMAFDGSVCGMDANNAFDINALDVIGGVGGVLYFSTGGNANVGGLGNQPSNADIYRWNGGCSFTRVFDASAQGGLPRNTANIDGLSMTSETVFCASFAASTGTTVPGIGTVDDEDVACYSNGTWAPTLYFDGSAQAGLDASNGQNVDAFDIP